MKQDQINRLMGFVEKVDDVTAPCELAKVANDRDGVEALIGTKLTDEEWEFVSEELQEIVAVDPLCQGAALDENFFNEGDYDSDLEYEEDFGAYCDPQ